MPRASRSMLDRASAMSPFYLGRRLILFAGHKKYPALAPDRGRITVFRDTLFHQRPRQVKGVVRQGRDATGGCNVCQICIARGVGDPNTRVPKGTLWL